MHYGEVKSELKEDHFKDMNETGGNIRTRNCSIMMVLGHKIPQILPMNGRRVKIYHKRIEKLCTKYFCKHINLECRQEHKVIWIDYVRNFMVVNKFIPVKLFGRWNDLVKLSTLKNILMKPHLLCRKKKNMRAPRPT